MSNNNNNTQASFHAILSYIKADWKPIACFNKSGVINLRISFDPEE